LRTAFRALRRGPALGLFFTWRSCDNRHQRHGVGAEEGPVEFRVLGPLEVIEGDRPLELGGPRQRSLLAYLLVHVNEAVSPERLIEELWGGGGSGANTVQVTVSRLRKALGAEDRLQTQPSGYVLRAGPDECDRDRFEQLFEKARRLLEEGQADEAADMLRSALGLWRGGPFADYRYEPFAQAEIARLEEMRMTCLETRIDADLALGRHVELVSELEALTREQPLRQRPRAQLMLALYRSGRHADALELYQATRRHLVEELGIEPASSLRELHQAILRQEADLELAEPELPEPLDLPDELPPPEVEADPDTEPPPEELPPVPAPPAARKTVTVLVVGIAGHVDPEVRHRLGERLSERVSPVLERHGAAVERLGAGRVMGVFGVPRAHEDDALRAVHAAAELRNGFDESSDPFCLGIDTGRMLTGDPGAGEPLVTGDAVDVAVQLQQIGRTGWICIGEATRRLVVNAVTVEEIASPPAARVAGAPSAWRLLELFPDAPAFRRRFDASFIGREVELAQLGQALGRATRERRAHLATVFGDAGVGKSRLVQELGRSVEDRARMLTGRCLSYGEGITYWPLREIVAQAAGERGVRPLLDGSPDADVVAARLESAIGSGTAGAVTEEVFWAVRKLVEVLARESPLVLSFEDVHWAEPTLLDLIEHLADWVRDAPVLIVCLARPELLDGRPSWAGGKLNASSILLEPLTAEESAELLEDISTGSELTLEARRRIADAAAGNPLFLEQMLAMLSESENVEPEIAVPPAIQALLAARLDRLEPAERHVLACASIEGEIFHVGGVAELAAPYTREEVAAQLMSLVRKELIRFEPPDLTGDEAFRFRHALIRDAAYEELSKETRSELHGRYAAWLEHAAGARVDEYEEFLGFHLERAFRFRAELGDVDDRAVELAEGARLHLASAGRSAFRRGDTRAAINLLERARVLPTSDERASLELAPDLGFALFQAGELERADSGLTEAIEEARALGDRRTERHAWLVRESSRLFWQSEEIDPAESLREGRESLAVLQQAGDDLALARAWAFIAFASMCTREPAPHREAGERALEHARRAGSRLDEAFSLAHLGWSLVDGATPVGEGIQILEGLLQELATDPLGEAIVSAYLANLVAMEGRFDDARALTARSRAGVQEFVGFMRANVEVFGCGRVEAMTGDLQAAERTTRAVAGRAAEIADHWFYVLASNDLARAVCDLGRPEEGLRILEESEQYPAPPDIEVIVKRTTTRALALARLGQLEEAETVAREAIGLVRSTEFLGYHAEALLVLAEALRLGGRGEEAAAAIEEAAALYERKGNVAAAERTRVALGELR
jgi:DNA-binding SARP family transcriptional activator